MKILLVGYDPYDHGEDEFEDMTPDEISDLAGVWCKEYDMTNPSFSQVECLVSDVESWAEKGGLVYVKELK